jgi:hypothetical protein
VKVGDLVRIRSYDIAVPIGTHGIITKVVKKDDNVEEHTVVKVQLMLDPAVCFGNLLNFACVQLEVVSESR